ncbi:pseudouridine synthase, partial [Auriculariales sp. MPI-PUGE-AT-0066]
DAKPAATSGPSTRAREGKRGRGRPRANRNAEGRAAAADGSTKSNDTESKQPRLAKRKCALLLGFCGTGYSGMQRQLDLTVKTIEGDLFVALVKAGAISEDNSDDPSKSDLQRAARTDAGVHAAGNVVSIKVITEVPGVLDIVAHINSFLPPTIRLWSILRTQNSFSARTSCDSRRYTYTFPSHILLPPRPGTPLHGILVSKGQTPDHITDHAFWRNAPAATGDADLELALKRAWRVDSETLEALKTALNGYAGTHNFHNFTIQKEFKDRSCMRHMKNLEVSQPSERDGVEWISVLFHGQSFMLHQRKMISAAILMARTRTPSSLLNALFTASKAHIPKAPALGLLLEHPLFDTYNGTLARSNTQLRADSGQAREPIDFGVHRDNMEAFKAEYIYKEIREREAEGAVFDNWVKSIDGHTGADFRYLGAGGVIPPDAVWARGNQAFKEPISRAKSGHVAEQDSDEEDAQVRNTADMEG